MINTNINIRLTKIEDISLLPDIESSAGKSFRDLPDLAWIADDDVMSVETHLKFVIKGTSWLAEADDQIVGFLCAESTARDLHVWVLAVRREWQSKGIGRRLMKTVIEHAQRNEFISVTLTTFREVQWNEPFYRSLGFEMVDTEKMDPRLQEILHAEIQHGLPGGLRCAMRLLVSPIREKDA
ncbi:MAG: GNAT family N-acetyltransferase [Anaerolineaceae bacterium]|nr:GNAT family N-acetyltransferase [Anaerolineaceae bacterium]